MESIKDFKYISVLYQENVHKIQTSMVLNKSHCSVIT